MSDTTHRPVLLEEDRIRLIEFADRQHKEKISLPKFIELKAVEGAPPIPMRPQFRMNIGGLAISLIVQQVKTGQYVRFLKAWLTDKPFGHMIDPKSLQQLCRLCGFTGKLDDWIINPEQGSEFLYANVAQVILPGTHATSIQVTHNNPTEEDYLAARKPS